MLGTLFAVYLTLMGASNITDANLANPQARAADIPEFVLPRNVSSGSKELDFLIQLDLVNSYVNKNCVYTEQGDKNPWGRCSFKGWKGNCKDFALEKKAELEIAGLDPRRLAIWYVMVVVPNEKTHDFDYMGHAVLVVDDKWVLDNRYDVVLMKGFQESQGYQFVCRIPDKNLYDGPSRGDSDPGRCERH